MKHFFFLLTMGFALFAMFFGAGNLVFPLKLGVTSQENWLYSYLGFAVTGVLIPLVGFYAMSLFDGNYHAFFRPLGQKAGLASITLILLLLGPCGAVARCLALCYETVHPIWQSISLFEFSLLASLVVFLFSFRENKTIPILGKFLTPFKLATLAFLVYQGLSAESPPLNMPTNPTLFWTGLTEGLETLDLLAALAFSCFLCPRLKTAGRPCAANVGLICGVILGLIYAGFCFIAARHASGLATLKQELLLISLSEYLIGPWGAKLTMLVVLLACLTTVIALTSIFAEFLKKELFKDKIRYEYALATTLLLAIGVSLLRFEGIVAFLLPLMQVAYPALIVLCLAHIWQKEVRLPFFTTFGASLAYKLLA